MIKGTCRKRSHRRWISSTPLLEAYVRVKNSGFAVAEDCPWSSAGWGRCSRSMQIKPIWTWRVCDAFSWWLRRCFQNCWKGCRFVLFPYHNCNRSREWSWFLLVVTSPWEEREWGVRFWDVSIKAVDLYCFLLICQVSFRLKVNGCLFCSEGRIAGRGCLFSSVREGCRKSSLVDHWKRRYLLQVMILWVNHIYWQIIQFTC